MILILLEVSLMHIHTFVDFIIHHPKECIQSILLSQAGLTSSSVINAIILGRLAPLCPHIQLLYISSPHDMILIYVLVPRRYDVGRYILP